MLGGELFGTADTLLPQSLRHPAIMGLRVAASNYEVGKLMLGKIPG